MVNGLHLYSAFIQSAVQCMPLIHPFTHTFTHQRRLAAMQGTNQLVRSNWGLGVSLRDTSTRPGWDRTGNPPTARRQLLPPQPHRPTDNAHDNTDRSHSHVQPGLFTEYLRNAQPGSCGPGSLKRLRRRTRATPISGHIRNSSQPALITSADYGRKKRSCRPRRCNHLARRKSTGERF